MHFDWMQRATCTCTCSLPTLQLKSAHEQVFELLKGLHCKLRVYAVISPRQVTYKMRLSFWIILKVQTDCKNSWITHSRRWWAPARQVRTRSVVWANDWVAAAGVHWRTGRCGGSKYVSQQSDLDFRRGNRIPPISGNLTRTSPFQPIIILPLDKGTLRWIR